MLAYESVPGTGVTHFAETEGGIRFFAEGCEDAQITLDLAENSEYEVFIAGKSIGKMATNVSGKLNVSVELADAGEVEIKVVLQ